MNPVAFVIWFLQIVSISGILEEALSHFEPLHSVHMTHRIVKRSLDANKVLEREIEFDVLNRHFHLKLKNKKPVVAAGFRVTAVNKYGTEREVTPALDNFYHGYDFSYPGKSDVLLYFDDEDTITASVQTSEETYLIEPSWRHVPESHNYSMIAYRRSDLNIEKDFGKQFCEGIRVDGTGAEHEDDIHDNELSDLHRVKRQVFVSGPQTPPVNTCPLYLVADYRYFRNMGEGNIQKTTSYLLGLIDRIDNIYRETMFSYGFVGMGFEVKEIKIHETPSTVAGGGIHYNEAKLSWDTKELLEAFSEDRRVVSFCLGHLFTAIRFPAGTLGLSYVASRFQGDPGGICSHQVYYKGGRQLYLNTGWSSSVNRYNRSLLTDESLLVTAHGHNWGSEHDPDTAECSPSSFNGGKYIMYTYSVSGYDQNNKVFSNCSRRSMGAVLQYKSPLCFTKPSGSFCGNFRIEQGEECDAGPRGRSGNDPCCNRNCQLRPKARCSDSNHECCLNCQYKPSTAVCRVEQQDSCEAEQYCNGSSPICPPSAFKPDNSPCLNRGKCRQGVCLSFCESEGLHSCVCDNETQSCFWCCKETLNSICKPHPNNYTVPNGTACVTGYCDDKGVCKKQEHDLIERIWQIIESITPDTVIQFMRANIVGTVIVFSLVIWIPASCVVCHLDRKKKREDEKHRQWLRSDNRSLVLDEDQARGQVSIHRTEGVRVRRGYPYVNIPKPPVRTTTFI